MINRSGKGQSDLVLSDLANCNNTSWILPDFMWQSIARNLRQLGNHSNVGATAYNEPQLVFQYEGLVPTSLFGRLSMIQASVILECWPQFINRTDLNIGNDIIYPTAHNILGNIQVVFVFLGGGLAISIGCMGIELVGTFLKYNKFCMKTIYLKFFSHILMPSIKNPIKCNSNNIIRINFREFNMVVKFKKS